MAKIAFYGKGFDRIRFLAGIGHPPLSLPSLHFYLPAAPFPVNKATWQKHSESRDNTSVAENEFQTYHSKNRYALLNVILDGTRPNAPGDTVQAQQPTEPPPNQTPAPAHHDALALTEDQVLKLVTQCQNLKKQNQFLRKVIIRQSATIRKLRKRGEDKDEFVNASLITDEMDIEGDGGPSDTRIESYGPSEATGSEATNPFPYRIDKDQSSSSHATPFLEAAGPVNQENSDYDDEKPRKRKRYELQATDPDVPGFRFRILDPIAEDPSSDQVIPFKREPQIQSSSGMQLASMPPPLSGESYLLHHLQTATPIETITPPSKAAEQDTETHRNRRRVTWPIRPSRISWSKLSVKALVKMFDSLSSH